MRNNSDDLNPTEAETSTETTRRKLSSVPANARQGTSMGDMLSPAQTTLVDYNLAEVEDFLALIFHAGQDDDEHMPLWAVQPHTGVMGYPTSEEVVLREVFNEEFKQPRACYLATSTLKLNAQGQLRHKNENFASMRFLVLDDIGTKVPVDKLPKALKPTYIIESSEGNFQYGYVLEEPVTDVEAAKMLVQLAYESGFSDAGGKVAVKLARLPAGINGKAGDKGAFKVKLISMDGPLWTPQDLLDTMEIQQDWAEILTDAKEVAKRRASLMAGASVWSHAKAPASNGCVDPVLEWLIENDQYLSDNGEWVTVPCPNAVAHTSGEDTAGYRPLGRGDDPTSRAFHCMHGHCTDYRTTNFLQHVASLNGPVSAVRDSAAALTSTWVFDAHDDLVWKIRDCSYPMPVSMSAFQTLHPKLVHVTDKDGKQKAVGESKLWKMADSRVNVFGRVFDPTTSARIVVQDGHNRVNMFAPPPWGFGTYEQHHIDKFTNFLEYLIPEATERKFFMDWLACKAQNMGFRGPAIVMIARKQGTGRSTLSDMVEKLFGSNNTTNVPFEDLVGDSNFNEWMESPLVVTDETLNTGQANYYRTYEKLKEMIDPRPKMVAINPKYGKKRTVMVHSSFMFFSNHAEALSISASDRRFFVLDNAMIPNTPQYFEDLNKWLKTLDGNGDQEWCKHVWRWLLARSVNVTEMVAPPVMTASKSRMLQGSKSPLAAAVDAVFSCWPTSNIVPQQVEDILEVHSDRLGLAENPKWKAIAKRLIKEHTLNYPNAMTISLASKTVRPRFIADCIKDPEAVMPPTLLTAKMSKEDKQTISDNVNYSVTRRDEIIAAVGAELDLLDL
jgi:hypothetical protein